MFKVLSKIINYVKLLPLMNQLVLVILITVAEPYGPNVLVPVVPIGLKYIVSDAAVAMVTLLPEKLIIEIAEPIANAVEVGIVYVTGAAVHSKNLPASVV